MRPDGRALARPPHHARPDVAALCCVWSLEPWLASRTAARTLTARRVGEYFVMLTVRSEYRCDTAHPFRALATSCFGDRDRAVEDGRLEARLRANRSELKPACSQLRNRAIDSFHRVQPVGARLAMVPVVDEDDVAG